VALTRLGVWVLCGHRSNISDQAEKRRGDDLAAKAERRGDAQNACRLASARAQSDFLRFRARREILVIGVIKGLELRAPVFPLLLKQVVVRGVFVGHRRAAEDFVTAIDTIGLKPMIDKRYPFGALPEALAHLERGPFGKIVIDVAE
jgi:D-arabinose 1-dehydrogenase-like Zn-dependent alcohol dehydrogenase